MNDVPPIVFGAPLYPPTIKPPKQPMPLWRFLPTFVRNPLRAIPEPVYHEPIFAPPQMRGRMAWITDPTLVEQILLEDHENFPKSPIEKRIFEKILGEGILTSEGPTWRWQRRTVAPLFRHGEVQASVPQMAAAAERLVAQWRRGQTGATRRIEHDMTNVTFDVLASTIFAGATNAEADVLKTAIGAYLEHTSWDIAYEILKFPDWVWHPAHGRMLRAARQLTGTMLGIVRREREKGWPGGGLMARIGAATDPETGIPMSEEQMAHNLLTFAAAGHETTAKALTWALYLLARAPDWQQRLHDEARQVIGDGPFEARHIDALVLTRQVVKEAMRLYPPAPVMGRMARCDVQLGAHRFTAGAMLVIPIYVIHRHRKLWNDPDRFDPTRFEAARESTYKRTQFMPFGFGPRICIGMSYAMNEAIVLLASFMRSARVTWDGRHVPEPVSRVTLRPKGGMPLVITMVS
ncbi:MAG: cytochrome P450 [Hyphomicrobiaceae bacterium]